MLIIIFAAIATLGINMALFVPAYYFQTDKLTDLSYALSFAVVAVASFAASSRQAAHLAALILIVTWAGRLGSFLFARIQHGGSDQRFDGMRDDFPKFLRFWLLQALSVFIILLPAILLWQVPESSVGSFGLIGFLVCILGLLVETIADAQKYRFNQNKAGDTWIDTGLWRMSRHPNYLGEITVWIGIYILAAASLGPIGRILALISPIYIAGLLIFVSGIPILEAAADRKWSKHAQYQRYKSEVPVLLPTLASFERIID